MALDVPLPDDHTWLRAGVVAAGFFVIVGTWALFSLYDHFFAKPKRILRDLRAQGLPGYEFCAIFGQLPELMKIRQRANSDPAYAASAPILPFFADQTERWGPIWHYSIGPYPRVVVTDPALVRAAYVTHNDCFPKNAFFRSLRLFGEGLATANGDLWSRQRRLINPAFNHREIKRMYHTMVECAVEAVGRWEATVLASSSSNSGGSGSGSSIASGSSSSSSSSGGPVLLMDAELASLTLEVISRCAFGMQLHGGTLEEGAMQQLLGSFSQYFEWAIKGSQATAIIPFIKYIPTDVNRKTWRHENIIRSSMRQIISARLKLRQHQQTKLGQQQQAKDAEAEPAGDQGGGSRSGSTNCDGGSSGVSCSGSAGDGGVQNGRESGKTDLLELMLNATETTSIINPTDTNTLSTEAAGGSGSSSGSSNHGSKGVDSSKVGEGSKGSAMSEQQLMDECLTFLVAGHETTSNLLTWTMLLLSQHPEYQEKARQEVFAVCCGSGSSDSSCNSSAASCGSGSGSPSADGGSSNSSETSSGSGTSSNAGRSNESGSSSESSGGGGDAARPTDSSVAAPTFEQLQEMKLLGWILNESLRLYPPAPLVTRTCVKRVKLSDSLTVPVDCDLMVPIAALHRSRALWGDDADDFRPERFANGISKAAKHPSAFLPFSVGPRTCIGQNFAVAEAKAIMALLLSRFSWRAAEAYVHHPEAMLTLSPKHGLPVLLTPLRH